MKAKILIIAVLLGSLLLAVPVAAKSQLAPPGTIYDWVGAVPVKTENTQYEWVGGSPFIYLEVEESEPAPAWVPKIWFFW